MTTEAGSLILDAELTAHRSLSPRGLGVVLAVILAFNLLVALFLLVIGARPVPIFLGLDVLGVVVAFRVSNCRRGGERVQVSPDHVRVTRIGAAEEGALWSSPTLFTRLDVRREADGVRELRVRASDRSLRIGAMLGPGELEAFADRLALALACARSGR